jgi:hypothetical protein
MRIMQTLRLATGDKTMEYIHVRKTDLARNTSRIIRNVLRGQPTVIENHGQPEAIVVDVVDFLILRALAHYYAGNLPPLDPNGPDDGEFAGFSSQARYNRAMQYYLAEQCSSGRMAELLEIPWIDVRERFHRLGVPLFLESSALDEVRKDAENARKWAEIARKQG